MRGASKFFPCMCGFTNKCSYKKSPGCFQCSWIVLGVFLLCGHIMVYFYINA